MNIIRRTIGLTIMLCLLGTIVATAQNKIDQLVESFSTIGSATFTSVVERDPQTRQVQKVVKVLKINGGQATELRSAFLKERESGNFTEQKSDNEQTLTLNCENKKQVRIYLLRLTNVQSWPHAQCTIIVKMKQQ